MFEEVTVIDALLKLSVAQKKILPAIDFAWAQPASRCRDRDGEAIGSSKESLNERALASAGRT